jgi:hypothetical protein
MLEDLFNKYDSDKSRKHNYHTVYEPDFEKFRLQEINFLEVGVFKGESVAAWLDFFPNATIYGLDIFVRVKAEHIDILKHPRCKWLKVDSTGFNCGGVIRREWPGVKFDVIIDDGLHTPKANGQTFTNLFPLLKDDGAYYVEDVFPLDIMTSQEYSIDWIRKRPMDYNPMTMDIFNRAISGNKITHYDLRKQTGKPDSYIIKIEK